MPRASRASGWSITPSTRTALESIGPDYDGATYVTDFQMEIFDDLGGEFIQIYEEDGTTYTYTYELTVSEGGEREYEIDIVDFGLVLACAHDEGQLDCIDVDSEAELLWVRER